MYKVAPLPHFLLGRHPPSHCGLHLGHLELRSHPVGLGTGCLLREPVACLGGPSSERSVGAAPCASLIRSFPKPQEAVKGTAVQQLRSYAHKHECQDKESQSCSPRCDNPCVKGQVTAKDWRMAWPPRPR